jgi:hypothetical protein
MLYPALLLPLALAFPPGDAPLIDYQQMERLKQRLANLVVEVQVTAAVPDGVDPAGAAVVEGQGVCVANREGSRLVLTSAFLTDGAAGIRMRSRVREAEESAQGRTAGKNWWAEEAEAIPEAEVRWHKAVLVGRDEQLGVSFLRPSGQEIFPCDVVALADPELVRRGTVVYSVDQATGLVNIFWAFLDKWGEPPLAAFLLTAVGLPIGGPLFSAKGKLVAFNVRRYTPRSKLNLSVTATQLYRTLFVARTDPAPERRRPRRGPSLDGRTALPSAWGSGPSRSG